MAAGVTKNYITDARAGANRPGFSGRVPRAAEY